MPGSRLALAALPALAFAVAEALAGSGVHSKVGGEALGSGGGDGSAVEVAGLVGPVLALNGVAVVEVSGDGARRLVVVTSAFDVWRQYRSASPAAGRAWWPRQPRGSIAP